MGPLWIGSWRAPQNKKLLWLNLEGDRNKIWRSPPHEGNLKLLETTLNNLKKIAINGGKTSIYQNWSQWPIQAT